ncbi:hypothetical protein Ancab_018611 [Ancistrocladus abbreviatus]
MMSILLAASALSALLLLLTCTSIFLIFHHSQPVNNHTLTTMPNYTAFLTTAHLRSAWNLLLQHTIFHNYYQNSQGMNDSQLPVVQYEKDPASHGPEECGVCLYEIEVGEEIRELGCDHLFHKVCLDRWRMTGHTICPLCRGPLAPPATVAEDGAEKTMAFVCFARKMTKTFCMSCFAALGLGIFGVGF